MERLAKVIPISSARARRLDIEDSFKRAEPAAVIARMIVLENEKNDLARYRAERRRREWAYRGIVVLLVLSGLALLLIVRWAGR